MLVPEIKEVHLGRAVVRQVFKISKVGAVAGCFVTQGTFERSAKARLIREGREIYKGSVEALKRFKDDVSEVREGFECGIKITNFDDLKIDDVIEAYRIDENPPHALIGETHALRRRLPRPRGRRRRPVLFRAREERFDIPPRPVADRRNRGPAR